MVNRFLAGSFALCWASSAWGQAAKPAPGLSPTGNGSQLTVTPDNQTGTGTVSTLESTRWNAKLYSVTGDGVTDDGPALTTLAATVSATGGGTIVLPPTSAGACYFIKTYVNLPNTINNVWFMSDVPSTRICGMSNAGVASTTGKLFKWVGNTGGGMYNLTVDDHYHPNWTTGVYYPTAYYVVSGGNLYQTTLGSTGQGAGVGFSGATAPSCTSGSCSDGAVTWNFISAWTNSPANQEITSSSGTDLSFHDLWFVNSVTPLQFDTNGLRIVASNIHSNYSGANVIVVIDCVACAITDSYLENNGGFGISVNGVTHDSLFSGNVTHNTIIELIGATYQTYRNRIVFNHAQGSQDNGISETGYDNVIANNELIGNAGAGLGIYGDRNSVTGNILRDNSQPGKYASTAHFAAIGLGSGFGGVSQNNTVTGNTIDDDQFTPTQNYGFALYPGYTVWSTGITAYGVGQYAYYAANLYYISSSNNPGGNLTSGATPPTCTTGFCSDGNINWTFIRTFGNSTTVWGAGQSVTQTGVTVVSLGRLYTASTTGTTGSTPPSWSSGTQSDGGVSWTAGGTSSQSSQSVTNYIADNRVIRVGVSEFSDTTGQQLNYKLSADYSVLNLSNYDGINHNWVFSGANLSFRRSSIAWAIGQSVHVGDWVFVQPHLYQVFGLGSNAAAGVATTASGASPTCTTIGTNCTAGSDGIVYSYMGTSSGYPGGSQEGFPIFGLNSESGAINARLDIYQVGSTTNYLSLFNSLGSPASNLFATQGSVACRADGGYGASCYVKESGGSTPSTAGWDGLQTISLTTVASLGTCNAAAEGVRRGVSDATSPTYLSALTGGGSVHVEARCNGSSWVAE